MLRNTIPRSVQSNENVECSSFRADLQKVSSFQYRAQKNKPILYGPFLCAEPASNKENQVIMSHEILYKNVLLRV